VAESTSEPKNTEQGMSKAEVKGGTARLGPGAANRIDRSVLPSEFLIRHSSVRTVVTDQGPGFFRKSSSGHQSPDPAGGSLSRLRRAGRSLGLPPGTPCYCGPSIVEFVSQPSRFSGRRVLTTARLVCWADSLHIWPVRASKIVSGIIAQPACADGAVRTRFSR
jgi:hypothetical protein